MYNLNSYWFWKQTEPKNFEYSTNYINSQALTKEMCLLRIGWMWSMIPAPILINGAIVDVGAGNKELGKVMASLGLGQKRLESYDLVDSSITKEELENTEWDLAVFGDVLEHMPDIEEFISIPWRYAYISFPETPQVCSWEELREWRHFKPDEHIWMLQANGMERLLRDKGIMVLGRSNIEDLIRKPWSPTVPNISSLLAYKK